MELEQELKALAGRYITPMVAEDINIFLDFVKQHGYEITKKSAHVDTMTPMQDDRYITVRLGTKRVEDPAATTHPCSSCGKPMTLTHYDVVDGYVVAKTKPAAPELLAEHADDCDWKNSAGISSRHHCKYCGSVSTSGHMCQALLDSIMIHYSQEVLTRFDKIQRSQTDQIWMRLDNLSAQIMEAKDLKTLEAVLQASSKNVPRQKKPVDPDAAPKKPAGKKKRPAGKRAKKGW